MIKIDFSDTSQSGKLVDSSGNNNNLTLKDTSVNVAEPMQYFLALQFPIQDTVWCLSYMFFMTIITDLLPRKRYQLNIQFPYLPYTDGRLYLKKINSSGLRN